MSETPSPASGIADNGRVRDTFGVGMSVVG